MSRPVVSFTTVRYRTGGALLGPLHIARHRQALERTPGLRFFKLLGTGKGIGFSAVPDLTTWAMLGVWDSAAAWERFQEGSDVMRRYERHASLLRHLLLDPLSSRGRWSGRSPFETSSDVPVPSGERVAVLTRATIRASRLRAFWKAVPGVDAELRGNSELLESVGFGEVPWVRQGTLSVWTDSEAFTRFAYRSPRHLEAMRRTRTEGWYAEELFARFRVIGTS